MYIVQFEYDPEVERRSRDHPVCENCEDANATVYCQADDAKLCDKCDRSLHPASNKMASRHKRDSVESKPAMFGACATHPDKSVEFFCPTCHIPICVSCKMIGHHASGEAAAHKLIGVSDAYMNCVQGSETVRFKPLQWWRVWLRFCLKKDTIIDERRSAIENQIASIKARERAVEKNSEEIQQQIERVYQRALKDLKRLTQEKMTVLKGDEWELRRQMIEIQRLDDFLKYQRTSNNPTNFLEIWGRHLRMKSHLHNFEHFKTQIGVEPNIKCSGAIRVVADDKENLVFDDDDHPSLRRESVGRISDAMSDFRLSQSRKGRSQGRLDDPNSDPTVPYRIRADFTSDNFMFGRESIKRRTANGLESFFFIQLQFNRNP